VRAVDECLGQVQPSALPKIFGQRGQHPVQDALALPLLEPVVARLIRRIAPRQIRPWRARPQDPEDPVEHVARVPPWPAATPRRPLPLAFGDTGANRFPLLVREVHRRRYKHLRARMEIGFRKMEQSRSLTRSRGYRMRSSGRATSHAHRPMAGRRPRPRRSERTAPTRRERRARGELRDPGGGLRAPGGEGCARPVA
jgi:hypothetical protein